MFNRDDTSPPKKLVFFNYVFKDHIPIKNDHIPLVLPSTLLGT